MATLLSRLIRKPRAIVTDQLFPYFFASLDHRRGGRHVAPLNGQDGRAAIMEAIVRICTIEQIVETGTYRGATTAWFTQFGLPVHTVEANRRFAHLARLRFASEPLVHAFEMDSATFLEALANEDKLTGAVTLFYLDAHWGERLPLAEELRTVARAFTSSVVVVDDFRVADDPDYGFDDYGPGKRLDLEYVMTTGVSGLTAFFPALAGAKETGARRGCVVLTTHVGLADKLRGLPLLRPYPMVTPRP